MEFICDGDGNTLNQRDCVETGEVSILQLSEVRHMTAANKIIHDRI